MKTKTGLERRDEAVVCFRDMVFVVCGTALVITGHIYWAIPAFIGAIFRMEVGNIITFAKAMRMYAQKVRLMRDTTDQIVTTSVEMGILTKEEADAYREEIGTRP